MNPIKQGVKWLRGKQTIFFERRGIGGISQVTSVDLNPLSPSSDQH